MTKKINKILLVHKNSVFEKYIQNRRTHPLKLLYNQRHQSINRVEASHWEHQETLRVVKEVLQSSGVPYDVQTRRNISGVGKYDLVVTVGGDGTLLRTSHKISDQLVLGVNSSPSYSIGALCSTTAENFERGLQLVLKGKFKIRKLARLQSVINGKKLKCLALNDVLYANQSPAGTSRYIICLKNNKEEQRSSGVWIATAAGSTAAISAAGGRRLPIDSKKIQYVVREPFQGKAKDYQLEKGILNEKGRLCFINKMLQASLFVDGTHYIHPLSFGDQIVIERSNQSLHVVGF